MRRRILQATVSAVMVAVVLLGIPMGILTATTVTSNAQRTLDTRVSALARSVERRISQGEDVDAEMLVPYVAADSPEPETFVLVRAPEGTVISAGTPIDGKTSLATATTASGAQVSIAVSWWDTFFSTLGVVLLVVGAAAVAFGAGIAMAIRQSNRLAAPLVYLAASAEQLGSGQTRPRVEASGVEEIDLVAAELGRSADRMASRLAVERQFAADVSHQLRTPLAALSMRIEEIQRLAESAEVLDEARISLEQVERLVAVVDDLSSRSRRAGGGTTEPLRLIEVIQQQEEEWLPSFERAGRRIDINVAANLYVLASPGALAQVLATLVENSLRHGAGRTTLEARPVTSGRSGAIVIEVADEGPGIPDELATAIFDRDVSTGNGGTGLGLALARDLVAADGGRLELAQRRPPIFTVFLSGVPTRLDPAQVMPPGSRVPVRSGPRRRWGERGDN